MCENVQGALAGIDWEKRTSINYNRWKQIINFFNWFNRSSCNWIQEFDNVNCNASDPNREKLLQRQARFEKVDSAEDEPNVKKQKTGHNGPKASDPRRKIRKAARRRWFNTFIFFIFYIFGSFHIPKKLI